MMHISFGWTSPAVKARRKAKTRRDWKDSHAKKFKPGDLFTFTLTGQPPLTVSFV